MSGDDHNNTTESVALPGQSVHLWAGDWVARCAHGSDVWTVHRGTRYLAQRSLVAHSTECEWVKARGEVAS